MNIARFILLFTFISGLCTTSITAQPVLRSDYSYTMKIPSVIAITSSSAHMYILSNTDGLAVFRTRKDSLQWLYTAPGMQHRGHSIRADIRFAYLLGPGRRLTVLQPTSQTGVYSATKLPSRPLDAVRVGENLYVALGTGGLGRLNLATPESLDSPVQKVYSTQLNGQNIIDLATVSNRFYALSETQELFIFQRGKNRITFIKDITLGKNINRIFAVNDSLLAGNNKGAIFEIFPNGSRHKIGSIGEPVQKIKAWKNWLIIKGKSSRLWVSYKHGKPRLWMKNGSAGNYFAISKGRLWLSSYDKISRVKEVKPAASFKNASIVVKDNSQAPALKLDSIKNQNVPYPHALLIPLKVKSSIPVSEIQFNLITDAKHAQIRGSSLYWKPQAGDKGKQYQFKIIASTPNGKTASTQFKVNVQPFNVPPRFIPLRTISIPSGHAFKLPIRAIDPDGMNKHLIRYLGINLPRGASINARTGWFRWKPANQQIGKHTFRIIATDQYGAASSENVTILVLNTEGERN
jgi:hypothetical protein